MQTRREVRRAASPLSGGPTSEPQPHQPPDSEQRERAGGQHRGGLPIGGRVEVVGLVDGHEGRARHFTGCLIAPAAQPQSDPQAWYPQKQPGRHALT